MLILNIRTNFNPHFMKLETFTLSLIIIHTSLGSIDLLTGFLSLVVKKGKKLHEKFGFIFYYPMLTSALNAMIIAIIPHHENPFLFAIGIFSSYFIITGKRARKFKSIKSHPKTDKMISLIMVITGLLMINLPIILNHSLNIILFIFGTLGGTLELRDLKLYKSPEKLQNKSIKLHLSKMLGGYISATTAFIVVNQLIPGIYGWLIPSIIGSLYITFWVRKLSPKP